MEYSLEELKTVHNALDKKVAKMEREREGTRFQDHKDELKMLKKEKLALKDKIAWREKVENWDIQDSGIDFYE